MSKINDLIKKLCPNGVEYKSLKDVFELFSGMTGVTNKWADEGNCRFIDYMNVYKNNKMYKHLNHRYYPDLCPPYLQYHLQRLLTDY